MKMKPVEIKTFLFILSKISQKKRARHRIYCVMLFLIPTSILFFLSVFLSIFLFIRYIFIYYQHSSKISSTSSLESFLQHPAVRLQVSATFFRTLLSVSPISVKVDGRPISRIKSASA